MPICHAMLQNQAKKVTCQKVNFTCPGCGAPVANRVEPGKRPRSSMSPTLVFSANDGERGDLAYVAGSPGGSHW